MKWFRIVLAALAFLLAGCGSAQPLASVGHEPVALSAWLAYWDMPSAADEMARLGGRLASVSYFAACFRAHSPEDALFVPEEIAQARRAAPPGKVPAYLTVVNDVIDIDGDGRGVEKDLAVLKRVLSRGKVDRHIADIIGLAKRGNYQGVEIDYEQVWKDEALVPLYLDFTYRLSLACIREGLRLRIVLEPSMPMDAAWAKGPEYVVMLYNLCGTHSGPGPKADGDFILKMIGKMRKLPDERKGVALATGGCLWERSGLPLGILDKGRRFLTEAEAVALRDEHGAAANETRDASAALHFRYTDEDTGKECEVWYADAETLNAWTSLAASHGIKAVSLWRLGGNPSAGDVRN